MAALLTFLEIITFIFIFYFLLGCDFIQNKWHIITACFISMNWICFQSYINTPIPNTFIVFIIILLLFDCNTHFKLAWTIICTTLAVTCLYFLYSCTNFLFSHLMENKFVQHIDMSYFDCFDFLLLLIISPLFRKKRKQRAFMLQKISPKIYFFISIVCVGIFLMVNALELIFIRSYTKKILYFLTFSSILLIPLTVLTLILVLNIQYKNALLRQLSQTNQKMLILEKEQYKLLQDKNEALRSFRHDFNGHLLALQTYTEQQELDKLFQYINNLSTLQSDFKIYSTKNIIVDAILNQIGETLPPTVTFKVSGQFNDTCFIDDFDLCTLFTNLLNNAVEALENLTSEKTKELYVEIEANSNEIQIRTMNTSRPYTDQELANLTTSKKDAVNHGLGLINIRQVVNKYHGDLFTDYENGIFSTYVSCKNIR